MSAQTFPTFRSWLACSLVLVWTGVQPASAQQGPTERPPARAPLFEIAPRGYVQIDWRAYPDWAVEPGAGRLNHDTLEVRRGRFGVDGRLWRISFELTLDPQDQDGVFVKDAYAQLRMTRALRVRVGQFKLPGGREYQTSARSLDFMERSALSDSATPGRDIGAMLTGRIRANLEYQAGLFAGDGNGRGSRAGRTAAGRIVWTPAQDLELAGTFSEGRTRSVDADPANGLDGRAPSGYRFFDRLYVQGRRVRIGGDVEWTPGRWRVTGEAIRARDARESQGLDYEDLPSVVGMGWSAAVTREFGRRRGRSRSRLREWDLGFRYDALAFDDVEPATVRDSVRPRATDVRARAARTLTAGVSWSPVRWARLMGNAAWERYSEPRSTPEPGRAGYWTFGTRLQFELP